MAISYQINSDLKVRIVRYSGYISSADMKAFAERMLALTPKEFSYRGLLIFEDDVDLSGVVADDLLEMADAFSEAAERAGGVGRQTVAAVTNKSSVQTELRLWREFMSQEKSFAYNLRVFPTLQEACKALDLSDDDCAKLTVLD